MENFFTRYKNPLVLMLVLFAQVVYLATQIRVPSSKNAPGGGRLIRKWTITAVTPFEEVVVGTTGFFRHGWTNYIDLYNVRKQNRQLEDELDRMKLEQARLQSAADQYRRLQVLLDFKEHYLAKTVAAQVIASSGTDQSRMVIIDKGSRAGIQPDMAVITPEGIVGKVREVYPLSSQVLLVNDRESGAGVILESSRLQGILRGTGSGGLRVGDIMSDEKENVHAGQRIITSGGDRIYPKGLPVGIVDKVDDDAEGGPFLNIRVKPAANLDRLEEVLVVTKIAESQLASDDDTGSHRAVDVLAERLPSIPKATETTSKDSEGKPAEGQPAATPTVKKPVPLNAVPAGAQKKVTPAPTPGAGTTPAASPSPARATNETQLPKPKKAAVVPTPAVAATPAASPSPARGTNATPSPKPTAAQPAATERPPR